MEIRIYYECYEQAQNFLPLRKISIDYSITFIEKKSQRIVNKGGFSNKYSDNCNKILSRKNPDLLITIIKDNIEIPIFVVEFSTAAYTKDHELQRADNIVTCHDSNCFFVKVSPSQKISMKAGKAHGGDTKFSHIEPYAIFLQKKSDLAFHIDWSVDPNDRSKLIKDSKYLSIPKPSLLWERIFINTILYINQISSIDRDWREKCIRDFNDPSILDWISRLKSYEIAEDPKQFKSTRTKWIKNCEVFNKDYLEIKFRMGHAMDPSRGMMTYYSFLHLSQNEVMSKLKIDPSSRGWYDRTSKENQIENLLKKNLIKKEDALKCFLWGLNFPHENEILNIFKESDTNIIDLQDYIKTHFNILNNSIKTLARYSFATKLECEDFNLFITYGEHDSDLENNYKTDIQITKLALSRKLTEDLITFSLIHKTSFFKEKKIISVSYPGAQADTVILPEKSLGRKQIRPTIDIIAYDNENIYLCEVKDNLKKINSDKEKLEKFYDESSYKLATRDLIDKYHKGKKKINLCLAFVSPNFEKLNTWMNSTDLSKIDSLCVFIEETQEFILFNKEEKKIEPFEFPKTIVPEKF